MGIKSTKTISRKAAIRRIVEVEAYKADGDYLNLSSESFEPEESVKDFIDLTPIKSLSNIEKWTNKMLERQLDEPFYRLSMFEDYIVED